MISAIAEEVCGRGITRLCHFTPTRNLVHLVAERADLLSRSQLENGVAEAYTATDPQRWDGGCPIVC